VSFAAESGVVDLKAFEECRTGEPPLSIAEDVKAAKAVGGTGTPTVLIDGFRIPFTPDSAELDRLIRAALRRAASDGQTVGQ
jgi:hypothetical protein